MRWFPKFCPSWCGCWSLLDGECQLYDLGFVHLKICTWCKNAFHEFLMNGNVMCVVWLGNSATCIETKNATTLIKNTVKCWNWHWNKERVKVVSKQNMRSFLSSSSVELKGLNNFSTKKISWLSAFVCSQIKLTSKVDYDRYTLFSSRKVSWHSRLSADSALPLLASQQDTPILESRISLNPTNGPVL